MANVKSVSSKKSKAAVSALEPKGYPTSLFSSKILPLLSDEGNIFFSPYSLSVALGMTLFGAKGQTKSELTSLLEVPSDRESANSYFASLISSVVGDGKERPYELTTANALWIQEGLKLNSEYIDTIRDTFKGDLIEVNYKKNPEAAVVSINDWSDEQTKGKIPKIVNTDAIKQDTLLILTNAIYFKGKWELSFDKEKTRDCDFYGSKSKVATMHQQNSFTYSETDDFQALDLKYQGGDVSMLVVLPKENDGLTSLKGDLNAVYNSAINNLHYEETVNVALPKFKVETNYLMKSKFIELGITVPFSDDADFSKISSQERLKIDQVIQKAFVECDEEGTEAAAVTAVLVMRCTSVVFKQPINFNADHPFLFFIRNNKTNEILFTGTVEKL